MLHKLEKEIDDVDAKIGDRWRLLDRFVHCFFDIVYLDGLSCVKFAMELIYTCMMSAYVNIFKIAQSLDNYNY